MVRWRCAADQLIRRGPRGGSDERVSLSPNDAARIAEGQAALRRVATLVAGGVPPQELFGAVTAEVGRLLKADLAGMMRFGSDRTISAMATWAAVGEHVDVSGRWPFEEARVAARIFNTGLPAREDAWEDVPGAIATLLRDRVGVRSSVGSPIVVEGRVWGALFVHSKQEKPLAPGTESQVTEFTELVATAIANSEARTEVERLAQLQAALRRVATLVARGAPADVLFAAVAEEVGRAMRVDASGLNRLDPEGATTVLAGWSDRNAIDIPVGIRMPTDGASVTAQVLATGRPARIDDYASLGGTIAEVNRRLGLRSAVGVPIVVGGSLWGLINVSSFEPEGLPETTESRLADFSDLVATAVSNLEARAEVERLAQEQAALRRVATLVARGASSATVFAAVAEELGRLLRVEETRILRFEPGGNATFVATWGDNGETAIAVGTRVNLDGENVPGQVLRTGRPARIDDYANATGEFATFLRERGTRSAVGSPIVVQGQLWGVMVAASVRGEPLPIGTEERMAHFTELVSTAIANGHARSELRLLADEQAALRRVATLVARQSSPADVLAAVAEEVATLLRVDGAAILRFEPDATATVVAGWGEPDMASYLDRRFPVEGDNPVAHVIRTRRPARQADWSRAVGPLAEISRRVGVTCSVAAPIIVEGELWGAIVVATLSPSPLAGSTETRIGHFTELVATAIANVKARSELSESRARIVRTADQTRRRFERDLHDGVQQRLVALTLDVRGIEASLPPGLDGPRAQLSRTAERLTDALDDLRELSRGLHPAILSEGGLEPALRALARRSPVPTKLRLEVGGRLREPVEVAAYFVVSEALANAAKHSRASLAEVRVAVRDGAVDLTIHDDGIGGADPGRGSGLTGLIDRVDALGGTMTITSGPQEGTRLAVRLPL